MALALSYPTISGITGAPYISELSDTANIQDTINYFYYGSTGSAARTSLSNSDGIYGMLYSLQNQINAAVAGINVHENVKWATTGTLAATYAAGSADSAGGTGIGATITFSATGVQKIDSTTTNLSLNDRVLVKNGVTADSGTASKANGIYYVSTAPAVGVAGILTRALDSDNSIAGEFAEGDFAFITDGDTNSNEGWVLTTLSATGTSGPAGTIRIGIDGVTYTQYLGVGTYYVGTTAVQQTSNAQILTGVSLSDSTSYIVDNTDNTKRIQFDVTGTTGITGILQTAFTTAKTIAFPDIAGTVYVSSGTDVSLADGGTNASLTASNGGIVWSNATQLQILSGTATAGKLLRSGSSATPAWSTATFPDTATTAGTILRADGTNWVASTPTFPNTATSGKILYGNGTNWVESTPTYPNTATTAGVILRADGTNWSATTATYPTTTTVSQILYSSSANVISGLSTANNGVLVTSGTGVPSIATTLPAGLTFTTNLYVPSISPTSLSSSSTALALSTPAFVGSGNSGNITLTTGAGGSIAGNSGSITLDVGTITTGTRGTVNVGGTSSSAGNTITVNIGNTSSTTSIALNTTSAGTVTAAGKFGYATDGGNVTQLTSATTTVLLNATCGSITLFSAARAAGASSTFTFTNSTIAGNDILVFMHESGGTLGAYNVAASTSAGSATITVRNLTSGPLTEAPIFRFIVIKA